MVEQVELEDGAEQQEGRVSGTALEGTEDEGCVEGHGSIATAEVMAGSRGTSG